jgi:CTP:molybdopterin cytidylyltransferase MocA
MSVGGLILAAGAGRRFGGPKQLAELDGVPLLQHAVDAMLGADGIGPVRVVLGAHADRVLAAVDLGAATPVVCDGWDEGMAASLRCGVAALGGCDWVVVTLGDQPRITAQVIDAIVTEALRVRAGCAAVRAAYDGRPGHPVALARSLFPAVAALRGDVGARDLLDAAMTRSVEVGHLCRPDDVDVPADLEALRASVGGRRDAR